MIVSSPQISRNEYKVRDQNCTQREYERMKVASFTEYMWDMRSTIELATISRTIT